MTTLIVSVILLAVLNCLTGYWLFATIKALIKKDEVNVLHQQWIVDIREDVNYVYRKIKNLDDKQIFQKDDEVGVVFTDMVNLITKLNERVVDEVDISE
jgi:hypothetical protein